MRNMVYSSWLSNIAVPLLTGAAYGRRGEGVGWGCGGGGGAVVHHSTAAWGNRGWVVWWSQL